MSTTLLQTFLEDSPSITPATLTANTDNWNPVNLSGASVIRVATDTSRNLTGIVAPSAGRTLCLDNIGANDLILKHDITSTAANRFYCPGNGDYTLKAGSSVAIRYDMASSRWRVLASPQSAGSYNHGNVKNLFIKNSSPSSLYIDITVGEAILCSTAGVCVRHTNISLLNKQVFGSNNQDGSIGGNVWTYLWLVSNGTTVQEWFTQSPFNIPSVAATTHPYYKLISAFIVVPVGNNINFRQRDNRVDLVEGAINIGSGVSGNVTTPTWTAVQVLASDTTSAASGYRAPKDITRTVFGHVCCLSGATTGTAVACPINTTFGAWNSSNHPPAVAFCANGHGGMASYFEFVPQSNSIYWASTTTAGYITLDGYTLDI